MINQFMGLRSVLRLSVAVILSLTLASCPEPGAPSPPNCGTTGPCAAGTTCAGGVCLRSGCEACSLTNCATERAACAALSTCAEGFQSLNECTGPDTVQCRIFTNNKYAGLRPYLDLTNCLAVGCPPASQCAGLGCAAGQTRCSDGCVDTQTDTRHCGRCDRALPTGQACVAGQGVSIRAERIAAGGHHSCAIVGSAVLCWGSDQFGQRGDGDGPSSLVCSGPQVAAVDLAAGENHTCALGMDGTVRCWGFNDLGQLGDGSTTNRSAPVTVTGLSDAVKISAGETHTCAVRRDGAVLCWGGNAYGQLGDGSTTDRNLPAGFAMLSNAVEIAAGYNHTCAVLGDGTVRCWGSNTNGQLGDGSTTSSTAPVTVTGLSDAVGIATGFGDTCARLRDGTVRCWGYNDFGQLGDGSTTQRTSPVAVPGLGAVAEVVAGAFHTCARLLDGTARCWGFSGRGRLGDGSEMTRTAPVAVTGLSNLVMIAAGQDHTCAVLMDGSVHCWGANGSGQLGDGSTANRSTPTPVVCFNATLTCPMGETACGTPAACVDTATSTAHCGSCGNACAMGQPCTAGACRSPRPMCAAGQTDCAPMAPTPTCVDTQTDDTHCGACDSPCTDGGRCTAGMCRTPISCPMGQTLCSGACVDTQTDTRHCGRCGNALPMGQACIGAQGVPARATRLTAGRAHSCAIVEGAVRCWGDDGEGQRGDGAGTSSQVCSGPTDIPVPGMPPVAAAEIAAGDTHTCARLSDGSVRCWGRNTNGQLGDGSTTSSTAPVTVTGLSNAAEIITGQQHTCARLTDGSVRCWGSNTQGQLGDGSVTQRTSPVAVMGLSNVVEIAAGAFHTCARLLDGTVRCWGGNSNGQLGDGSVTQRTSPVTVAGLSNAVEIASTGLHTCARLMDGTVRCWGFNNFGQLGDGNVMTQSTSPVAVVGLSNAVEIATSALHTCARLTDGAVRCWGFNGGGQLGDGSTTNRTAPVAVTELSNAVEIAAGYLHTCARRMDGTVRCWGFNSSGQLGDGSRSARSTPATVICFSATVTCPMGQTSCGMPSACVDAQTDTRHCGACGRACAVGQTCAAGVCTGGCTPGMACRPAVPGGCDVAEICTSMGTCPADVVTPVGTTCRVAAPGGCDVAETCTGTNPTCPLDGFASATTVCRPAAAGGCDRAETCTGSGAACPTDTFLPAMTVCRAANMMTCDPAESCTGSSVACPMDVPSSCMTGQTCMAGACSTTMTVAGDSCTMPNELTLTGSEQTVMATTAGATSSAEGCAPGPDVFFRFTLTQREVVYVDTFGTSFDTQLRVLRGSCATAGAPACVDNSCMGMQSQLVQVLDAGTWVIAVDGASGASGPVNLHIKHLPVPGTGPVATIPGVSSVMLSATTAGASFSSTSCGSGSGPEAWWWLATCPTDPTQMFSATTCGGATFDTVLELRSAASVSALACNDDSTCGNRSTIATTIPAGEGLYVLVLDGFGSSDAGIATTTVTQSTMICTSPLLVCSGACVNLLNSSAHCGRCDNACPSGESCIAGSCGCPLGQTRCGGVCVNVTSDTNHCGACGSACTAGLVCRSGTCESTCATGGTRCGIRCITLGDDPANCGACDNACTPGSVCASGRCVVAMSIDAVGCADGTREAFVDRVAFPQIAACAGPWGLPGIFPAVPASTVPACATLGNSSTTAPVDGAGCASSNLCAVGWRICNGGDVLPRTVSRGCAASAFPANTFFAASVSGPGCYRCALRSGTVTGLACGPNTCTEGCRESGDLNNDFFGCGTIGLERSSLGPCDGLDRTGANNCEALPGTSWRCGGATSESITVTKVDAANGGVLCCRD